MSQPPPVVPKIEGKCFLVTARDGPDSAAARKKHLDGHLRHVEQHWRSYVTAGPIREPGGDQIIGSVFLVLAKNLQEAKDLMNGDPYITCGMYQSVEYTEFTNSIGLFPGGRIWKDTESIRHRAAGGSTDQPTKSY